VPKVDPAARRLFPEIQHTTLADREAEDYVVIRLLGEGDSRDLRSLVSTCPEETIRRVFLHRSRQLSRRDRAFWSLLLAVAPPIDNPLAIEVWPL
jgi:hypothetical protein